MKERERESRERWGGGVVPGMKRDPECQAVFVWWATGRENLLCKEGGEHRTGGGKVAEGRGG